MQRTRLRRLYSGTSALSTRIPLPVVTPAVGGGYAAAARGPKWGRSGAADMNVSGSGEAKHNVLLAEAQCHCLVERQNLTH